MPGPMFPNASIPQAYSGLPAEQWPRQRPLPEVQLSPEDRQRQIQALLYELGLQPLSSDMFDIVSGYQGQPMPGTAWGADQERMATATPMERARYLARTKE